MKRLKLKSLVLAAALSSPAVAQQVQVNIGLPTIHFASPPPLVVVQPGVQVVEDYDDEVFFSDGWYWVQRDDRWYRTRDHRGGWAVVERRYVPVAVVQVPRGKYKRWRRDRQNYEVVKVKDHDHHHGRDKHKGRR